MENLTEIAVDFKAFEQSFFKELCKQGCLFIQEMLEEKDRELMANRDTGRYRHLGKRTTVLKTIMGEVSFTRRYYRDKTDGSCAFLLDEAMGISRELGLISANLAEHIVRECIEKSYRNAAASISGLTGQSISAQGACGPYSKKWTVSTENIS